MNEDENSGRNSDYERELSGLLDLLAAVDQEVTPQHVRRRYDELQRDVESGTAADNSRGTRDAVHRTIVVVDIAESSRRTNDDQLVIREAMYGALATAFKWNDWLRCYHEDRGDGVLILVPPEIPKARLVTRLPDRLEAALARHNSAVEERGGERAAAAQVRLRIAVHAGEVTFDKHGVVGTAIDHTFRLADALRLKAAQGGSLDACALVVSDWFYSEVVYHHQDARPDSYRQVTYEVKGARLSAWMRGLNSRLTLESSDQDLASYHPGHLPCCGS